MEERESEETGTYRQFSIFLFCFDPELTLEESYIQPSYIYHRTDRHLSHRLFLVIMTLIARIDCGTRAQEYHRRGELIGDLKNQWLPYDATCISIKEGSMRGYISLIGFRSRAWKSGSYCLNPHRVTLCIV